MKFYYRYVNGLKEPDAVSRDIDPAMLGEILHDVMKKLIPNSSARLFLLRELILFIRDKTLIERTIIASVSEKFSG